MICKTVEDIQGIFMNLVNYPCLSRHLLNMRGDTISHMAVGRHGSYLFEMREEEMLNVVW